MLGFLDWIVQFFEMLWTFINNLVSGIVTMLLVVQNSIPLSVSLIGYVPSIIGASISAVVAIGVCKLLLGWGNS